MWDDDSITRRRIVQASAGAAAVSVLAGCMGGNQNDDDSGDGGDGGDGDDDGEDEPDPADWEGVEEVRFEAYTAGWEGLEPSAIEGEENPTILLFEGEPYTLAWENGDGASHNIEVRDEDDEVVDDLSTEEESGEDVEQELEIEEVTDEMAEYVCAPHEETMRGEIVVESAGGDGGDGEDDASTDGNESEGADTDGNDSGTDDGL